MSDRDYQPIACALHDRYEIAIMHRQVLQLEWKQESGAWHEACVMPVDIRVSNGEEFLVFRRVDATEDSEPLEIRLDKVKISEK